MCTGAPVVRNLRPTRSSGESTGVSLVVICPPAILPESEALEADRFELVEQLAADLAVEDTVGVVEVLEDEGDVDHAHLGDEATEVARAGHEHVDRCCLECR